MNKTGEQLKLEKLIQESIESVKEQYELIFGKSSFSLLEEYRIKIAVLKTINKILKHCFRILSGVGEESVFNNILLKKSLTLIEFENIINNRNLSNEVMSTAAHYLVDYQKHQLSFTEGIDYAIDLALKNERTGKI